MISRKCATTTTTKLYCITVACQMFCMYAIVSYWPPWICRRPIKWTHEPKQFISLHVRPLPQSIHFNNLSCWSVVSRCPPSLAVPVLARKNLAAVAIGPRALTPWNQDGWVERLLTPPLGALLQCCPDSRGEGWIWWRIPGALEAWGHGRER